MNNDPTEIESTVTIDADLAAKALAALEQLERRRERGREWKKNNVERVRETKRKWRENNRDKQRQYSRDWRAKNPDKVRAQTKRNYEKHREQRLLSVKKWQKNNREKYLETLRKSASNTYWKDPVAARAKNRANAAKRRAKKLAQNQATPTTCEAITNEQQSI